MLTLLDKIKTMYQYYDGTGAQLLLFWACVFLLLFWGKTEKKTLDKFIAGYALMFLFIYVCPITAGVIMKFCVDEDVYWRMLWMLPIAPVVAYVGTEMISVLPLKRKKIGAFVFAVILIATAGTNVFQLLNTELDLGNTKLPLEVEGICVAVKEDAKSRKEEEIRMVVPDELAPYIRQYDGTIKMPYGRKVSNKKKVQALHRAMNAEKLRSKVLARRCRKNRCNYLVYNVTNNQETHRLLEKRGFELVTSIGVYGVYYLNTEGE